MAKEATAKKVEEIPKKAAPVSMSRFGLEESFNQTWRVNAEMGTTPKDTLREEYWQHIATHFRPGDEIIVFPDDMAWKQLLHVVESGKNYTHVTELECYKLDTDRFNAQPASRYQIEFAGTHHKWRVVLDGRMLKDGFDTKGLAARWAANHEAAVDR